MLTRIACGAVAPCLFAAASAAQSFNIDIDGTPPPTTYGAFAAQPGTWNTVAVLPTPQPLVTLTGAPDNSTASITGPAIQASQGGIPAPETELYSDFAGVGTDPARLTVTQLAAGSYVAVLYSYFPNVSTRFTLTAGGVAQTADVNSPGMFPGFSVGQSMAQFAFTIGPPGGSVTIDFVGLGASEGGVLNGVQLAQFVGTVGCPQPLNSLGAMPAIVATGTIVNDGISAAANDLQLDVGLLPGPLPNGVGAILCFVANTNVATFPQTCPGVGTRCIGNPHVTRVFDPGAPAGSGGVGSTTGFGTYHLPVDLPSLAGLGIDVSPGATLHFQMIYRDFDTGMACGAATESVKRWTQSLAVKLY